MFVLLDVAGQEDAQKVVVDTYIQQNPLQQPSSRINGENDSPGIAKVVSICVGKSFFIFLF